MNRGVCVDENESRSCNASYSSDLREEQGQRNLTSPRAGAALSYVLVPS